MHTVETDTGSLQAYPLNQMILNAMYDRYPDLCEHRELAKMI